MSSRYICDINNLNAKMSPPCRVSGAEYKSSADRSLTFSSSRNLRSVAIHSSRFRLNLSTDKTSTQVLRRCAQEMNVLVEPECGALFTEAHLVGG